MAEAAGALHPILSPLHGLIARRRVRTMLRVALACTLSVLAALLILMLARRTGAGPSDPLPILIAVGIATALCSSLLAWARRRSPVEEAFFIDRASGFDQAYGTAVELAWSSALISRPVPAELMATVETGLDRISVVRLVRIFTPGFTAALVLVAALGAAVLLLPRLPVPVLPEMATENALSAPADTVTLETVAEMLAADAQIRQDPLLEAIARTLDARTSAMADEPMSDQMIEQVNDLLDQAAAAYGEDAPGWLGASEGARLSELKDALAGMDPAETPGAAPQLELAVDPYAARPDENPSLGAPNLYDTPSGLAGQPDSDEISDAAEAASMGEAAANLDGSPGSGPQLIEPEQLQSMGAVPAGAALDSGRGMSDAAGLGEEDIRDDDGFTRLGAAPGEDMVVSATPQAEGNRIRIEIVPESVEGVASGAANAVGGQTGTGSTEPVARDFVPAMARDITARYFERAAQ